MSDPRLAAARRAELPRYGVRAYHAIFTAYGFWLPNDPRGSWSDFVRSWELLRFGPATKTNVRRSVARSAHNVQARLRAKEALRYPPVSFTGLQARSVGIGFEKMVEKAGYTVFACSILPEHVHLVARYRYKVEEIVRLLKAEASTQLIEDGLHPMARWPREDGALPSCWARGRWKRFLNTDEDIRRSIRYVEENPLKEGKPRQRWRFVVPFE